MAVPITITVSSIDVKGPTGLFHVPELVKYLGHICAPSRDGRRVLMNGLAPNVPQPPLQVIVNWQALLNRLSHGAGVHGSGRLHTQRHRGCRKAGADGRDPR